jgi:hypothetical protein
MAAFILAATNWYQGNQAIVGVLFALMLFTMQFSNWRYRAFAILYLAAAAFITLSFLYYQFIVDDVYISLRYARNFAEGYGLVFNTDRSEPVEGYTNFLWVMFEAALFALKIDELSIIHIIRITGIICGIATILVTYRLTRHITRREEPALLAAIFLSLVPQFAFWCVGGLETGLYMLLIMSGIYRYLVEMRSRGAHYWSVTLLFLAALTRPEGLVFALLFLLADLAQTLYTTIRRGRTPKLSLRLNRIGDALLIFVVFYSVYFVWRYSFYDLLLPNTFYAKKLETVGFFIHRLRQVSRFMLPLLPFIVVAYYGLFHVTEKFLKEKRLLVLSCFLLFSFCFAARNEWMPGHRYELPFVPILIIFFAIGIHKINLSLRDGTVLPKGSNLAAFCLTLIPGFLLLLQIQTLKEKGDHFAERLNRAHVPLGKWLLKYAPQNARYASWDMGAVPYFSKIPHVIDINAEGLLNTHTTRIGYNIDHLMSFEPDFLVLPADNSFAEPYEIRHFYCHEKMQKEYEFLFAVAFDKEYLMNVYRHKKVTLDDEALIEGRTMAITSLMQAGASVPGLGDKSNEYYGAK